MLRKNERIKYSGLFQQAYQKGKKLYSKNLRICFTKTLDKFSSNLPLLGFAISKNFSKKAVSRNRLKRQLREVYRLYRMQETKAEPLKKLGLIVVSPAKDYALTDDYHSIKNELETLLDKALKQF